MSIKIAKMEKATYSDFKDFFFKILQTEPVSW